MRDAELAEVLNKTEFTIVRFYQKGNLSQRLGQLLFERPFAEIAVQVYKLWKEGDVNQRLKLVVRDWLEKSCGIQNGRNSLN